MKRSFDSRPVVATELTKPGRPSAVKVARGTKAVEPQSAWAAAWITGFWNPAEIQNHLQQLVALLVLLKDQLRTGVGKSDKSRCRSSVMRSVLMSVSTRQP